MTGVVAYLYTTHAVVRLEDGRLVPCVVADDVKGQVLNGARVRVELDGGCGTITRVDEDGPVYRARVAFARGAA
jgi:hypothetical protein